MNQQQRFSLKEVYSNVDINRKSKSYRITPLIVSLREGIYSHVDIKKIIEFGLITLRITNVVRGDDINIPGMVKQAEKYVCDRYDITKWPVAICIDIPHAAAVGTITNSKSQRLKQSQSQLLNINDIVTLKSNIKAQDKRDSKTIYLDDPYALKSIKTKSEITLQVSAVKLLCLQVVDETQVKCKVVKGGHVSENELIYVHGVKQRSQTVVDWTRQDMDALEIAKKINADVLTVLTVQNSEIIKRVHTECKKDNYNPIIISMICDQEGLDNFDDILEVSGGIILERNMIEQPTNSYTLAALQMQLNAKCKKIGKPFFLSGNILEQTIKSGMLATDELSDITNAVTNGCGFMLRNYRNSLHLSTALKTIDYIAKFVESTVTLENRVWRLMDEFPMPVNAAEASLIACALIAKQSQAVVIVLPTTSGSTAMEMARMSPSAIIITVSKSEAAARRLQLYRGIFATVYNSPPKESWPEEMRARTQFAIDYGARREIVTFGDQLVSLCKANPGCSFPNTLRVLSVSTHYSKGMRALKAQPVEDPGTSSEHLLEHLPPQHHHNHHHHHYHHHHHINPETCTKDNLH